MEFVVVDVFLKDIFLYEVYVIKFCFFVLVGIWCKVIVRVGKYVLFCFIVICNDKFVLCVF